MHAQCIFSFLFFVFFASQAMIHCKMTDNLMHAFKPQPGFVCILWFNVILSLRIYSVIVDYLA